MNKLQRIGLASGILAFASLAANATTITHLGLTTATQNASGGPTNFDFGNGVGTEVDVPLSFTQFSCALLNCHLTGINFSLASSVTSNYTVTNNNNATKTFSVNTNAEVDFGDQFGTPSIFSVALPTSTTPLSVGAHVTTTGSTTTNMTSTGTYAGLDGGTYALTSSSGGTPSSSISGAEFYGAGNVTLYAVGNYFGSVSGSGNTSQISGVGSETGSLQYVYQYDEVVSDGAPEPATFAMFGGALIGLGFLRKRVSK